MLRVEIETDNAAFVEAGPEFEVARLLREAADKIADGRREGRLRDCNGGEVGRFVLLD